MSNLKQRLALQNMGALVEQLSPALAKMKTDNPAKFAVICEYAENHANYEKTNMGMLNESAAFPTFGNPATLQNVNGMGPVMAPSNPGGPAKFYTGNVGSGDKFPTTLPISIEVAARTVGFDLVPVIPMAGPVGVLAYIDYVYAGGKTDDCPDRPQVIELYFKPTNVALTVGGTYWGSNGTTAVQLKYVGNSRISGDPIFRVGQIYDISNPRSPFINNNMTLSMIFDGIDAQIRGANLDGSFDIGLPDDTVVSKAKLVQALVDHINGFTGAGTWDEDPWNSDQGNEGQFPNNPMSRGTGETSYYRTMNMKAVTKFIEAETYQVAMTVTTEQIQDMDRQWGLQIMSMAESALINEISQAINKHILSRAFALGWSNNIQLFKAQQTTLNLCLNPSVHLDTVTPPFLNKIGFQESLPVPPYQHYGDMENLSTAQRRLAGKVLFASNIIYQRGRRGPGNFVVTNVRLATAIQDQSNYAIAPLTNNINQASESLYPMGTVAGLQLYVDPNMNINDNRVLVGRRGANEEPGLKLCPYIMAETISTIVEGTMSPKIAVKSRYALVEAGHFPETQYYTFWVNGGEFLA
jgi:hypothetical protein